jgi:arylsulfatase A
MVVVRRIYFVIFHPAFLVACVLVLVGCKTSKSVENRPNIIFILADDLGYETIAANGGESYKTPNIDKLASGGMRFEHCYAQPQCTPSRVQLLTGIYNVRNYADFGMLDTTQVTIAQLFRNAGYVTGCAGKWQLGKNPDNADQLGFDDYLVWQLTEPRADSTGRDTRFSRPVLDFNGKVIKYGPGDFGPKIINDYSLDFIERNSKKGKPFFLFYSMMLTHCPFSPTPDSPEWMTDSASVMTYKGQPGYFEDMVSYMDKMVGHINSKLEALGIANNTLVIFTGDNGTDTPIVSRFKGRDVAGAKLESTDAGTRVPLIAKWPGVIKAGTTNSDLIDFTDFMPTMLNAGNIEIADSLDLDGVSFLPQLKGEVGKPRKWIYSWYLNPVKKEPRVFARNHQYKLYETGEFYDVPNDYQEKNSIVFDNLSEGAKAVYVELQSVLSNYSKRRLDAIRKK